MLSDTHHQRHQRQVVINEEGWNMFKGIKKAVDNFINKLAKESEKSFGNERLDCCNLDRPKSTKK